MAKLGRHPSGAYVREIALGWCRRGGRVLPGGSGWSPGDSTAGPGDLHPRVATRRLALAALGCVIAAAAPSSAVALAGIAVAGLGTSVSAPLLFGMTGRVAGEANRGGAMGTVSTLGYIGYVLGPAVVGVVTRIFDLRIGLMLLGAGAVILALLSSRIPAEVDGPPATSCSATTRSPGATAA